ncbi:unnamed protein product [Timema podura]|uniref:Uncharacterized protein n=1 Tax=Timema podura TaxID=61482 RepID=A0ABN7PIU4_TIMPD|nr:unnamed protein product [Timema podura]
MRLLFTGPPLLKSRRVLIKME